MKVVAILASGPSMSQDVADRLQGVTCIAVNDTYRLAPWAYGLYAADAAWWHAHPEALEFSGVRLCAEHVQGVSYAPPRPLLRGGNSALRATQWAVENGAEQVMLYGVDLDVDHLTHWHGDHVGLRNPNLAEFEAAIEAWNEFSKEPNPPIINCSPTSKLDCFPRIH
jgi:hypothetical protein